jgi:hypothetical protein
MCPDCVCVCQSNSNCCPEILVSGTRQLLNKSLYTGVHILPYVTPIKAHWQHFFIQLNRRCRKARQGKSSSLCAVCNSRADGKNEVNCQLNLVESTMTPIYVLSDQNSHRKFFPQMFLYQQATNSKASLPPTIGLCTGSECHDSLHYIFALPSPSIS